MSLGILGCTLDDVIRRPPAEPRHERPHPPPRGGNTTAIDAARSLPYTRDRGEAFEKIAKGAYLTEDEQVYLIDSVAGTSLYTRDKGDVLAALAANPSLTEAGAGYLVESFPKLGLYSSDQKRVTDILIDRSLVY